MLDTTPPFLVGAWATLGEPRTAVALAQSGVDWVALDAQHGHFDDRALRDTFALRREPREHPDSRDGREPRVPVLVRLLTPEPHLVGRALDSGADGVIVPLVESAEQAVSLVRAAHYPPRGDRSWGPFGHDPASARPADPLVAIMIETRAGLDALDAIAATDGLDMIFVGPFDLSLGLGVDVDSLLDPDRPDSELRRIVQACAANGVLAGAYAGDPARAQRLRDLGFTWVAVGGEASLLGAGVDRMRQGGPETRP